MSRYSISQIYNLGTGDGRGNLAERSSVSFAIIDNLEDELLEEFSTMEAAEYRLEQILGIVSVTHFVCPTCTAESGEWCFRWRTDRDGVRYKEVMGGSLLTCPDRLRLTEGHNREIRELDRAVKGDDQ
jgi:hypothetical protein